MRWIAIIALLALPALAQDKRLEQAEKLEKKAEKLLDQGKRKEAFEALAKAVELRRQAKEQPAAKPGRKPAPKPEQKPKPTPNPPKADPVDVAHGDLDAALRKGNLEGAKKASARLHEARAEQAKRIAALERQLDDIRTQLDEIRALLQPEKRPK